MYPPHHASPSKVWYFDVLPGTINVAAIKVGQLGGDIGDAYECLKEIDVPLSGQKEKATVHLKSVKIQPYDVPKNGSFGHGKDVIQCIYKLLVSFCCSWLEQPRSQGLCSPSHIHTIHHFLTIMFGHSLFCLALTRGRGSGQN